jgi:GH15 family glucan-1,4-alpha-glucosidase
MPSVEDHALIGDCQTAALVASDGTVDWLCWPRFDSESCFSALVGRPEHGYWRIAPTLDAIATKRHYRGPTLILETLMETVGGAVSIVDFMSLRGSEAEKSNLVRMVIGRRGMVPMRMELVIRFDYGRIVPWVTRLEDDRLRAVAGPHSIILQTPVEHRGEDRSTIAEFTVKDGDCIPFVLTYEASHLPVPRRIDAETELKESERFWLEWSNKCTYRGEWREPVLRSLITIKALTFQPTGGIVAAPTSSLPEKEGGGRNWDYRYCWLRDSTFTLLSLLNAGYRDEAEAWTEWLFRAIAGSGSQVQPVYGLAGERRLEEYELPWLPGHRGSTPVRIGNAAYRQLQLDSFGAAMEVLHQAHQFRLNVNEAAKGLPRELLHHLEKIWHAPDEGIWEVRSERQHFVHSKVMAWAAFSCGIEMADEFGLAGPVDRWRKIRDRIHEEVCEQGFDEERGAFIQAYGVPHLDAANLIIPIVGFLPPDDPRVLSTTAAIQRELMHDGLVLRYDTALSRDGLPPGEGAFLACSFWLADNLILQGREAEARQLFERVLILRNDVGLLSEQYDLGRQTLCGNFPQAFSHFALIDTVFNFASVTGTAREAFERENAAPVTVQWH